MPLAKLALKESTRQGQRMRRTRERPLLKSDVSVKRNKSFLYCGTVLAYNDASTGAKDRLARHRRNNQHVSAHSSARDREWTRRRFKFSYRAYLIIRAAFLEHSFGAPILYIRERRRRSGYTVPLSHHGLDSTNA